MSIDHIISEIYDSNIEEVILIGDNTTLLNYGHQFIEIYDYFRVSPIGQSLLLILA